VELPLPGQLIFLKLGSNHGDLTRRRDSSQTAIPQARSEICRTKIYVSGGMVVVKLLVETKGTNDLSERFLVLDEDTGEAKGYYQSGESYDVCMTRDQELVFLSVNQNKQTIVIARIW
jgi:hypothetical protein